MSLTAGEEIMREITLGAEKELEADFDEMENEDGTIENFFAGSWASIPTSRRPSVISVSSRGNIKII